MFVTPEGLNTMIHGSHNTLVTQWKCYRIILISDELTPHISVGTRYYMKCQHDACMLNRVLHVQMVTV